MQGAYGALGTGLAIVALIGLLIGVFFFAAAVGMIICAGLLIWALGAAIAVSYKDWRSGSKDHRMPEDHKPFKPP